MYFVFILLSKIKPNHDEFYFAGMSNITNFEEQPPESPLDVLSRVATMVEKSQTSPAAAAVLPAAKSADQTTANLMYPPSMGTDHNELNSTHSPPPSTDAHQNTQSKSKTCSNPNFVYQFFYKSNLNIQNNFSIECYVTLSF